MDTMSMYPTATNSYAVALVGAWAAFMVLMFVYYVVYVIGTWKVFTKAGIAGWKSIIPIYNTYLQFKISWKTSKFWQIIGMLVGVWILYMISLGVASFDSLAAQVVAIILLIAVIVLEIIILVIEIKQWLRMAKAYGKGTGFGVGLILLNPIFMIILGFGKAEYQGPQE